MRYGAPRLEILSELLFVDAARFTRAAYFAMLQEAMLRC